jgi:hypothetical protein
VAVLAELMGAVVLDAPDLLIGRRLSSTMRGLWPDARRNIRSMGRTLPVGAMLMSIDMRREVEQVVQRGVPILAVWGCFDQICTPATATEFSALTGEPVQWLPGGHSWMLPRPRAQADVLRLLPSGRSFMKKVALRRRELAGPEVSGTGPDTRARTTMRIVR